MSPWAVRTRHRALPEHLQKRSVIRNDATRGVWQSVGAVQAKFRRRRHWRPQPRLQCTGVGNDEDGPYRVDQGALPLCVSEIPEDEPVLWTGRHAIRIGGSADPIGCSAPLLGNMVAIPGVDLVGNSSSAELPAASNEAEGSC
jgi:hypothetical protein